MHVQATEVDIAQRIALRARFFCSGRAAGEHVVHCAHDVLDSERATVVPFDQEKDEP